MKIWAHLLLISKLAIDLSAIPYKFGYTLHIFDHILYVLVLNYVTKKFLLKGY